MVGLSVVLLVTLNGGSYALAGALSAVGAIATAIGSPLLSRRVDRLGQSQVLPMLLVLHGAGIGLFVWAVLTGRPLWLQFVLAAAFGATLPSIGSLVRARWTYALSGDRTLLQTAYAWESIVDEFVFVVGPPLATILAVQVTPWAGLAACAVLTLIGGLWLASQKATQPPPREENTVVGPAVLRLRGMIPLLIVMVLVGGVFGAFELSTVAFAAEQNARQLTGALLALYAVGSLVSGLIYGARQFSLPLESRLLIGTIVMTVTVAPFLVIGQVGVLAVGCLVAGVGVSPVLIIGSGLVERLVPDVQLTEGFALQFAGLSVGIAMAAPVAGYLIDAHGSRGGYSLGLACAALAAICTALARSTLAGAALPEPTTDPRPSST